VFLACSADVDVKPDIARNRYAAKQVMRASKTAFPMVRVKRGSAASWPPRRPLFCILGQAMKNGLSILLALVVGSGLWELIVCALVRVP
jgi:hypothetical protein